LVINVYSINYISNDFFTRLLAVMCGISDGIV